jgi:hypothetical protein
MYRPLLKNKVTMTELKTCVTIYDLMEINALLDMEDDIQEEQMRQQEATNRSKK